MDFLYLRLVPVKVAMVDANTRQLVTHLQGEVQTRVLSYSSRVSGDSRCGLGAGMAYLSIGADGP